MSAFSHITFAFEVIVKIHRHEMIAETLFHVALYS